jgi:hypothetical protein
MCPKPFNSRAQVQSAIVIHRVHSDRFPSFLNSFDNASEVGAHNKKGEIPTAMDCFTAV